MVNLLNSKMVIICRVELVSPNIERKYLKQTNSLRTGKPGTVR